MSTPSLSTFVRERVLREEQRMQTAFPAKVMEYQANQLTVTVEPQFIETWVTRDNERVSEEVASIENVPVCFPWWHTLQIDAGMFGLVICTKYSLDRWRQQLTAVDPGDLRRFTMSGATFHPVTIGEIPNQTLDFVALKQDVEDIKIYLDDLKDTFNNHVHTSSCTAGGSPVAVSATQVSSTYTVKCSSKVKVAE